MGKTKKEQKGKNKETSEEAPAELPKFEQGFLSDVSDFNEKRLSFKPIISNKDDKSTQYNCVPRYVYSEEINTNLTFQEDGAELVIRTKGPIPILKGGIPSIEPQWRPTDNSRMYFWLCLSITDKDREYYKKIGKSDELKNLEDLGKLLRAIDDVFSREISKYKNKNNLLVLSEKNKKGKTELVPLENLSYTRMVRKSPKPKNGESQYEAYERCKVFFATKYDANLGKDDPKEILTTVYVGDESEKVNSSTPTEIEEHFKWGSSSYLSLKISKLYAMKATEEQTDGDGESRDVRKAGIGLKCNQIWVTTKSKQNVGGSSKQYLQNVFIKSKPENEESNEKPKKSSADESSSESSSSDEEDKPKTKTKPTIVKEESDDSSSSSSESESDKKTKSKKAPVKNNSDSEEEAPKKGKDKAKAKPPPAKEESDDSSSSSSSSSSDSEPEPEPEPEKKPKSKKKK